VNARWLLTNGVYVVTATLHGRSNGMAAAWVTRVSAQPVLVAVSIWRENLTHRFVQQSGSFVINILGEGQQELARRFGRCSGRTTNKFDGLQYQTGITGAPILDDVFAYLDCRVIAAYECGDHTLFIGEVKEEGGNYAGMPLVYRHEDYFELDELPV